MAAVLGIARTTRTCAGKRASSERIGTPAAIDTKQRVGRESVGHLVEHAIDDLRLDGQHDQVRRRRPARDCRLKVLMPYLASSSFRCSARTSLATICSAVTLLEASRPRISAPAMLPAPSMPMRWDFMRATLTQERRAEPGLRAARRVARRRTRARAARARGGARRTTRRCAEAPSAPCTSASQASPTCKQLLRRYAERARTHGERCADLACRCRCVPSRPRRRNQRDQPSSSTSSARWPSELEMMAIGTPRCAQLAHQLDHAGDGLTPQVLARLLFPQPGAELRRRARRGRRRPSAEPRIIARQATACPSLFFTP